MGKCNARLRTQRQIINLMYDYCGFKSSVFNKYYTYVCLMAVKYLKGESIDEIRDLLISKIIFENYV